MRVPCAPEVCVLDGKEEAETEEIVTVCAKNRSYKATQQHFSQLVQGSERENPAVPACQYSLQARWEAGSTWQMPLGSIMPEGWKDPPHNRKPAKQEETGIPNDNTESNCNFKWIIDLSNLFVSFSPEVRRSKDIWTRHLQTDLQSAAVKVTGCSNKLINKWQQFQWSDKYLNHVRKQCFTLNGFPLSNV